MTPYVRLVPDNVFSDEGPPETARIVEVGLCDEDAFDDDEQREEEPLAYARIVGPPDAIRKLASMMLEPIRIDWVR